MQTSFDHDAASLDWTPAEEKRVRRATDFKLLGFIILLFIFLQFDRTNLGNALTSPDFKKTLGVTQSQINTGQTLFTLGIVIFELPSNVVAKRVGPNIWIPCIMFCWGLVTLCQAFLHDYKSFYATRFLLASFEAGFIPGMAFFIGRFYKNEELGLRYAIFWSANNIAGIFSGLVALGLLKLDGHGSLSGYQYLFLIEGCITCLLAALAFYVLPFAPAQRRVSTFFGRGLFTSREMDVITSRTLADDPAKSAKAGVAVSFSDILATVKDWQIYGHCASAFLSSVILTPMNTYAPSLVKSLGFAGYSANGMQAPGSALALIFSVSLAWNSDRSRERGFHVATAMILSGVGALWLALPKDGVGRGVLYAGVVCTQGAMGTAQGINAAWMVARLEDRKRLVALAMYVMSIQLAGFAGSNVFKAKDAPRYSHGLIICAACAFSAAATVLAWKFLYAFVDRRRPAVLEASKEEQSVDFESEKKEGSWKGDVAQV